MRQNHFEFDNTAASLESAGPVLTAVLTCIGPVRNFIDVGCGVGAWSKVMEEKGFTDYHLIDHPSLHIEQLLPSRKDRFIACDLDSELPEVRSVDLAICIEVLEHFKSARAKALVEFLTRSADVILFSAAVPGQGGRGHLNEQPHNYWHRMFEGFGYHYFDDFKIDLFRSVCRRNFFHAQNVFVYYNSQKRTELSKFKCLFSNDYEIRHISILNREMGFAGVLRQLPMAFVRSFRYHTRKIFK